MQEMKITQLKDAVFQGRQCSLEGGRLLLWPLSGVEVTLRSRELYVELEEKGDGQISWFAAWVDGAPVVRFPVQKGKNWYPVLLGMDETVPHRVTLVNESQPIKGDGKRLILHSIRWEGELLPAEKMQYQIEFIGDSLTTAEGCAGPRSAAEWKTAWMSPSFGYAKRVGDVLNARVHLISQSGWGVCSDWTGVTENNIPGIYEQLCGILPEGQTDYDFPVCMDAVVLNLGTNDYSAVESMPEEKRNEQLEKIVHSAEAFLRRLRILHPDAYILWSYGMCGGELGPYLERAVNTVRAEGDVRVGYVQLLACAEEETGSLHHPGVANHEKAAAAIAEHLMKAWFKQAQKPEENIE